MPSLVLAIYVLATLYVKTEAGAQPKTIMAMRSTQEHNHADTYVQEQPTDTRTIPQSDPQWCEEASPDCTKEFTQKHCREYCAIFMDEAV